MTPSQAPLPTATVHSHRRSVGASGSIFGGPPAPAQNTPAAYGYPGPRPPPIPYRNPPAAGSHGPPNTNTIPPSTNPYAAPATNGPPSHRAPGPAVNSVPPEAWSNISRFASNSHDILTVALISKKPNNSVTDNLARRTYIVDELTGEGCMNSAAIRGWYRLGDFDNDDLDIPNAIHLNDVKFADEYTLGPLQVMRAVEDIRHFFDFLSPRAPLRDWLGVCGNFLVEHFLRYYRANEDTISVTRAASFGVSMLDYALEHHPITDYDWDSIVFRLSSLARHVKMTSFVRVPTFTSSGFDWDQKRGFAFARNAAIHPFMAVRDVLDRNRSTLVNTPELPYNTHTYKQTPANFDLASAKEGRMVHDMITLENVNSRIDRPDNRMEEERESLYIVRALMEHREKHYYSRGQTELLSVFADNNAEVAVVTQAFQEYAAKIKEIEARNRRVNYPNIRTLKGHQFLGAYRTRSVNTRMFSPDERRQGTQALDDFMKEMKTAENMHANSREPFTLTEAEIVECLCATYLQSAHIYGSLGTGWLYAMLTMKSPATVELSYAGPRIPPGLKTREYWLAHEVMLEALNVLLRRYSAGEVFVPVYIPFGTQGLGRLHALGWR